MSDIVRCALTIIQQIIVNVMKNSYCTHSINSQPVSHNAYTARGAKRMNLQCFALLMLAVT
eukprot:scaffold509836_cov19-Prasinocladus_malaysianus.AAC.1